MNIEDAFTRLQFFLMSIKGDHRISGNHIALFLALFQIWIEHDCKDPFPIERRTLMESAKVSGIATYHKCIKDLHAYGYIKYQPSFSPNRRSKVYFSTCVSIPAGCSKLAHVHVTD